MKARLAAKVLCNALNTGEFRASSLNRAFHRLRRYRIMRPGDRKYAVAMMICAFYYCHGYDINDQRFAIAGGQFNRQMEQLANG